MKICAIIQARQTSSRLPGKALIDIAGKPALQRVIERLRASKMLDDVIVATTTNEADDVIISLCEQLNCKYYRGSENDVLSRVLEAARAFDVDVIVEITADCLLVDWNIVDNLVKMYFDNKVDYCSNVIERTFPRGFDCQVFSTEVLEKVNSEVDNNLDREHVSTWIYLNKKSSINYTCLNLSAPAGQNRPDIEVTLDTPEDLELISWLYSFESSGYNLPNGLDCQEVINLIDHYPGQYEKVSQVPRKDYFQELAEAYNLQKIFNLQDRGWNDDYKDGGIPDFEQMTATTKKQEKPLKEQKKGAKKDEPKKRGKKKA